MLPNGTHDSRPASAATTSSFDFTNRPISHPVKSLPSNAFGNLSRTDQIVLRHFWEYKYEENKSRDLHFVRGPAFTAQSDLANLSFQLRFPFFGQYPAHQDLVPYCEIYHLVKTSPGAKIIGLGSANGVYIG